MLYIKLPKGQVANACTQAAETIQSAIDWSERRYKEQREIDRSRGRTPCFTDVVCYARNRRENESKRDLLQGFALHAKRSTGDVYVAPELWKMIEGHYAAG